MRITGPQCHSRCRIKGNTAISDLSQGKCPECGHLFPIPPGLNRGASTSTGARTVNQPTTATHFKSLQLSRASWIWLISGFCLTALLAIIFVVPAKTPPQKIKKNLASSSSQTTAKTPTKSSLTPEAQAKVITQIKHHAQVGDANISIAGDQLQLALLVTTNTPVIYAERLGRQFAHYLQAQITTTEQQQQKPAIKISVYYPSGTRIAVAANNQSDEEEVLPQMENIESLIINR